MRIEIKRGEVKVKRRPECEADVHYKAKLLFLHGLSF
jgi:hypothetical protein